ncbi:hypothetical protein ES703_123357 [subsurface metagenome]
MGQGFLTIYMFSRLYGSHGDYRMSMIRCSNDNGVEILLFLEHDPVVLVHLCLWISLEGFCSIIAVNIAQRNDILTFTLSQIAAAHTADTNAGNIELLARRRMRRTAQHMPGDNYKRRGSRCSLEKFTSADLFFDFINFCHGQILSIFFLVYINKFIFIIQGFRPSCGGNHPRNFKVRPLRDTRP